MRPDFVVKNPGDPGVKSHMLPDGSIYAAPGEAVQMTVAVPPDFGNHIIPVPQVGLAFLKINKNACTGIQSALYRGWSANPEPKREWDGRFPLVAMWRDPCKRAESLYSWLLMPKRQETIHEKDLPYPNDGWVPFLQAYCSREYTDMHAATQSELCYRDGLWMPDLISAWDFEQIKSWFKVDGIPHENPSTTGPGISWDPDLIAMMKTTRFAEDFLVWDTVRQVEFAPGETRVP